MENLVFNKLAELGIDYEFIQHPAALTTEDADRFTKVLEGVHTKSMFQTNKKKTYFLNLKSLANDKFRIMKTNTNKKTELNLMKLF